MTTLKLFTDGSVNSKTHIGYGAYLFVDDITRPVEVLKKNVQVRRFEHTSSTKLELQIFLLALDELQRKHEITELVIYTDSQNIVGLVERRERLQKNDFYTSKNKRLKNYELYQQFYAAYDQFDFTVVKVLGHQQSHQKNEIDQLFTLVDRASRAALRQAN